MPTVTLTTTGVFSGYTLAELRAEVLRMLRVANTARFSPTGGTSDYDWIDLALNRGQEDFARQTRCLKGYAIVQLKADRRVYRMPEECIDLDAVYYYNSALDNGYRLLSLYSIGELNDEVSDWRVASGSPERCYFDRDYGAVKLLGLNPIPDSDGSDITPDTDYGTLVTWICPLYTFNQDYGVIINISGDDEYILASQSGVAVEVEITDNNLYIEFSRLPQIITPQGSDASQYSELPREYQQAIIYYAVSQLLQHNPDDSAEYKRAATFLQLFQREVDTYINKRKRPASARRLRARAMQWNWTQNMDWYRQIP